MAGENCLLDRRDELLAILLGGHMILFILPKCFAPAECALQSREKVWLSLRHMTDKCPQYAFVCEHAALKIGVFDGHGFDLSGSVRL